MVPRSDTSQQHVYRRAASTVHFSPGDMHYHNRGSIKQRITDHCAKRAFRAEVLSACWTPSLHFSLHELNRVVSDGVVVVPERSRRRAPPGIWPDALHGTPWPSVYHQPRTIIPVGKEFSNDRSMSCQLASGAHRFCERHMTSRATFLAIISDLVVVLRS